MQTYKNPTNNHTETITKLSYLWSFLFGWMYFAYKGSFFWALINFLCAFATAGLSWFIFPFFTGKIMHGVYMRKGWVKVDG